MPADLLPRERAARLVGAVQYLAYDWPRCWQDSLPTAQDVIERLKEALEKQGFAEEEES